MMINPLCDSTHLVYITMLVKGIFSDDRIRDGHALQIFSIDRTDLSIT